MKYIKTYRIFEGIETEMDVSDQKLISLPDLPDSLKELYCFNNKLTKLPELPDTLKILDCVNNKLTSLPELPDTLYYLSCSNNQLTSLPELPDTLNYLHCSNNKFEEPIKKEIIDKFDLKKLYTKESIELFKTYEFQKEFLDRTGRIQDIKEWILPEIKKEFSYLYDSEEIGLL